MTESEIFAEIVRLQPDPPHESFFLGICTVPKVCSWCGAQFGLWRDDHATDNENGWAWRRQPHPDNECLWSKAHRAMSAKR